MSSSKLAAFQAKIAKKVSEITYKDTELPKSAIDVLSAFKSASQIKTSTSNTYRIDLCPDFTPCFLYLLLSAKADTPALEQANNPKVSRYTYVAYQMHLIYIWFLLHDLYISPGTSIFAESLITDKHFSDIIEDTLDYPVPPAVINVISFWSTTCLESQKNIWITPSFNNYLHYTHFGRSFPVSILLAAHNVIAENSANAKVPDLLYEFATTPLYKIQEFVPNPITAPNTRRATTYTPDKYFSLLRQDATNNAIPAPVETKVNQILRAFLNFDSIKGMKAKSPFAPIPIVASKHPEPNGYLNPYVMLTSLTVANSAELGTVYDSVKTVILLQKLANTNLAACFTSVASSGAANHGTSDFPTPHWDIHPLTIIADPANAVSKVRSTPLADHQTSIAFKTQLVPANAADWNAPPTWTRRILDMLPLRLDLIVNPALPGALTRLHAVLSGTATENEVATVPLSQTAQTIDMLTLATPGTNARFTTIPQATDNTDITDIDNSFIDEFPTGPLKEFDEHNDTYPSVKVIMPQGNDSDSAHLVTLRGLIIYAEDITSSSVPQLTSRSEVYDDNAQFLQSAIPYSATHLAIHFKSTAAIPSHATRVTPSTSTTQSAVSMLRSTHAVFMPRIERNVFHLGHVSTYPGLTMPATRTRIPAFSQTFLGHQVPTRARTNNLHIASGPSNTPSGHLLVWSPYTFRAPSFQIELEDVTDRTPVADVLKATHFLVNLRTLFGTSQTVYEVASPIRALPSV